MISLKKTKMTEKRFTKEELRSIKKWAAAALRKHKLGGLKPSKRRLIRKLK